MIDPADAIVERSMSCSMIARRNARRPAGTAGTAERFLFAEISPPWPTKIEDAPELADAMAATGSDIAVRALRRVDEPAHPRHRTILAFWHDRPGSRSLRRLELEVDRGDLAGWMARLATEPDLGAMNVGGAAVADGSGTRDVVVCTHGARDRCCGRLGIGLARGLKAWAEARPGVNVWRTTHLGGHRFAPTLVDLPTGRSWAYMDAIDATAVLSEMVDPATISRHYRGWWGLGTAAEQLVEAEAWKRLRWRWPDVQVQGGMTRALDGRGVGVELRFHDPAGGRRGTILAQVGTSPTSQVVSCGKPPEPQLELMIRTFVVT